MAFPEAKLKALEEKISHPRWVVPVLPEQELEALLIASTELAAKGLLLKNIFYVNEYYYILEVKLVFSYIP